MAQRRSAKARGRSTRTAKRIGAATTHKTRRARSEVSGRSKARRAKSRTRSGARRSIKTATRRVGRKGGRARSRK
jgi:hypothetical protein